MAAGRLSPCQSRSNGRHLVPWVRSLPLMWVVLQQPSGKQSGQLQLRCLLANAGTFVAVGRLALSAVMIDPEAMNLVVKKHEAWRARS